MTIRVKLVSILLLGILLVSCGESSPAQPSTPPQKIATEETDPALSEPTLTPTVAPPTPTATPEPAAAARVNGQIVTLEEFEKEVERYEEAQRTLGRDPAASGTLYHVEVLDALIERLLIEQAAESAGISVSDEELEEELQRLIENSGGQESFDAWLEMSQYSLDEFRLILHSGMISQQMYEQVAMNTPGTVEQVHARHIVVDSAEIGELVLAKLQEGTDFATLAADYSRDESTRMNGGDLDFFPRGLLLSPEVEEAAFALEVGATSGLVTSSFGYHIIQVLEKDPARPVTPDIQQRLREIAFGDWLQQLWSTATVERNI